MRDLTSAKLIYLKGFLFLACGLLAGGVLLLEGRSVRTGLLLALCVWCFCRFYYFCFYVIEHYVDRGYRFAGVWSFARYLLDRRGRTRQPITAEPPEPQGLGPDGPRPPANG